VHEFRADPALAALDMESSVREVALSSRMEELKRRLEASKCCSARPRTLPWTSGKKQRKQQETERLAHRARMAEAGGQLLTADAATTDPAHPSKGSWLTPRADTEDMLVVRIARGLPGDRLLSERIHP
jgi:hypothetical protein